MDPLFVSLAGFAAAVVVVVVEGRKATAIAAIAVGIGLLPTASTAGGDAATALVAGFAFLTALTYGLAYRLGGIAGGSSGSDPAVPLLSPAGPLFGPRATRVAAATLSLPAASWLSFNIPIGSVVGVQGLLFASAFVWCCGAARILLARAISDIAVGTTTLALAAAAAWTIHSGDTVLRDAAVIAALAPIAAATIGWMAGVRDRRTVAS